MDELPRKARLKDGREARLAFLSRSEEPRELQRYINSIIEERAYITLDWPVTLKEERKWKEEELSKQRRKSGLTIVARVDGRIAGIASAFREKGKGRDNVCLGVSTGAAYRGTGLGEAMLRECIRQSKRILKPRNIYLSVLEPNKPARALYAKLGFKEFARYPRWIDHYGKVLDQLMLKL